MQKFGMLKWQVCLGLYDVVIFLLVVIHRLCSTSYSEKEYLDFLRYSRVLVGDGVKESKIGVT